MVKVHFKNVIYLLVHGYLEQKNDDRMRVLVTESSEIFFFFSFLSFLYLLSENENRAPYWKGNLFPF